jgi:hypothetical protein
MTMSSGRERHPHVLHFFLLFFVYWGMSTKSAPPPRKPRTEEHVHTREERSALNGSNNNNNKENKQIVAVLVVSYAVVPFFPSCSLPFSSPLLCDGEFTRIPPFTTLTFNAAVHAEEKKNVTGQLRVYEKRKNVEGCVRKACKRRRSELCTVESLIPLSAQHRTLQLRCLRMVEHRRRTHHLY